MVDGAGGALCANEINEFICYSKRTAEGRRGGGGVWVGLTVGCHFGGEGGAV